MFRILVGITAICFVPGLVLALYRVILALTIVDCEWEMFIAGLGISSIIWFFYVRKNDFLAVLEHELTHMLVALLLLKVPIRLHAHHQGDGMLECRGTDFGDYFVTLAPYFVPTITVSLLAFGWMVGDAFMPTYIGMLGFSTGFNLWSMMKETHAAQPDLQRYPLWFNFSIIVSGNLLFTGLTLAFVASGQLEAMGGYRGMLVFLSDTWRETLEIPGTIMGWLS
jgi:hypothetical protein